MGGGGGLKTSKQFSNKISMEIYKTSCNHQVPNICFFEGQLMAKNNSVHKAYLKSISFNCRQNILFAKSELSLF